MDKAEELFKGGDNSFWVIGGAQEQEDRVVENEEMQGHQMLNNNDALELFKKTFFSAANILQVKVSSVSKRRARQ